MKLTREVDTTVYKDREAREASLKIGQTLILRYRRGEKVVGIVGGRWNGWYFCASDGWIRQSTDYKE